MVLRENIQKQDVFLSAHFRNCLLSKLVDGESNIYKFLLSMSYWSEYSEAWSFWDFITQYDG